MVETEISAQTETHTRRLPAISDKTVDSLLETYKKDEKSSTGRNRMGISKRIRNFFSPKNEAGQSDMTKYLELQALNLNEGIKKASLFLTLDELETDYPKFLSPIRDSIDNPFRQLDKPLQSGTIPGELRSDEAFNKTNFETGMAAVLLGYQMQDRSIIEKLNKPRAEDLDFLRMEFQMDTSSISEKLDTPDTNLNKFVNTFADRSPYVVIGARAMYNLLQKAG